MTTYVVPTDSVHTSAALCDYLVDRVGGDDAVHAIYSQDDASASADRDGEDALNAVYARLGAVAAVETHVRGTTPAGDIRALAAEVDADEVVIGSGGSEGVGSITEQVVTEADCPVVVIPLV